MPLPAARKLVAHGTCGNAKARRATTNFMVLDYSVPGEVTFRMDDYVTKMVADFEEMAGKVRLAKTPAADHLFEVRKEFEKLSK